MLRLVDGHVADGHDNILDTDAFHPAVGQKPGALPKCSRLGGGHGKRQGLGIAVIAVLHTVNRRMAGIFFPNDLRCLVIMQIRQVFFIFLDNMVHQPVAQKTQNFCRVHIHRILAEHRLGCLDGTP